MTQKLIQIGNSKGLILSKALLDVLDIDADQNISIHTDEKTHAIIITKEGTDAKELTVSPRFLTILEKVNKEYGPALKKLSQL